MKTRRDEMDDARRASEQTVLADIERRLVDEFPSVSHEVVGALIRREHARFQSSRIRDFIPLLTEKRARRQLRHRSNVSL
jgi:hypothetical protein